MRWMLFVGLLTGCTAEEGARIAEEDGRIYLLEGALDEIRERALVAADGPARLAPGGPALEGERWSRVGSELLVVDAGRSVRVLSRTGQADVLLYLDRADLLEVVAEATVAVGGPAPVSGGWGAALPGGLEVEVLDELDRWTLVGWTGERFAVEAWVAPGFVDEVYLPDARPRPSSQVHERIVAAGADLRDAPGGEPFAWVGDDAVSVASEGDDVGPWVPISALDGAVVVRGWAHAEDVEDPGTLGMSGFGWGHGCCCGVGGSWPTNVPAGTAAYDEAGRVVARVARDTFVRWDDPEDWVAWTVSTAWGEAPLWLPPLADLHPVDELW